MQVALHQDDSIGFYGTVYRGKFVTDEEVKQYQNSIGDLVFFRGFESSSLGRATAESFAETSWRKNQGEGKKLLLEIDCNPEVELDMCPIYVKRFSADQSEEEVLFPLLAGFKIESCDLGGDWLRVRLKLAC